MSFYWITRLDAILTAVIILGVCLLVFSVIDNRRNIKITRCTMIIGVLLVLIAIFTPTTKQACAIYFVDYLQENKDVRELPDKVIKSANLYFDELIEKLDEHNTERE